MHSSTRQSGLTLVELMIALTLSLILVAGVLKIFISNKQTYAVQDAMARVQENGRFALSFLTKEIRMAGFMGCQSVSSMTINNNVLASAFSNPTAVTTAIAGFNGTNAVAGYSYTTGTVPTAISAMGISSGTSTGNIEPNTDAIFLRRAYSCPGGVISSTQTAMIGGVQTAQLKIDDNTSCNLQQADIVMVTNCQTADIFGVSNVVQTGANGATISHGANWNNSPMLSGGYGADSFLLKMKSEVYYIGVGASGQPALFRRELVLGAVQSDELVEGIESMSILYGVDTDNDGNANIFTTAAAIDANSTDSLDMNNVISIRVSVRARTLVNNVATSTDATYGDKRIRRTFTTTIGIRNRMS